MDYLWQLVLIEEQNHAIGALLFSSSMILNLNFCLQSIVNHSVETFYLDQSKDFHYVGSIHGFITAHHCHATLVDLKSDSAYLIWALVSLTIQTLLLI